jgi:hypothetical protein
MCKKNPIVGRTGLVVACAAVGAGLFLTGCCTVRRGDTFTACCDNVTNGIPIITCQPLNVEHVRPGDRASFYVGAQGKDLSYQWFFIGGGVTAEPRPLTLPTANQPLLEIPAVGPTDYGLYFCLIAGPHPGAQVTQTRQASLGGPAALKAGGTFAAVQNPIQLYSPATACGITGSTKKVLLGTQTPNSPPATPTENGFLGNVLQVIAGVTNAIPNDQYALQFFYNTVDRHCCTIASGATDYTVQCPLTPGRSYYITVFFKPNQGPPTGTQVIVQGTWTH